MTYTAQHWQPPTATDLSSNTSLALVLTVIVLALFSTSTRHLTWSTLQGFKEMAQFKLSMLAESVGFKGLGQVDWSSVQPPLSEPQAAGGDKGKGIVWSARDLKTNAAQSGDLYPGLLNVSGNLCFLNATLQSMASLPSLLTYLSSLPSTSSSPLPSWLRPPPTPVALSLLRTLSALNTPSAHPSPLRPMELASALANSSEQRRRLMASSEQQDAHELWVMLREAVEEEVGKVKAYFEALNAGEGFGEVLSMSASRGGAPKDQQVEGEEEADWDWKAPKDPHMLLTAQRVQCMTCGYTRDVRHTSDQQIPLSVPAVAHISLLQLLREHTKPDLLSDYACRRCSVQATMEKLEAQRDRLALPSAPSATASTTPPTQNGSGNTRASTLRSSTPSRAAPSSSFDLPTPSPSSPATMTTSRKQRLRKVIKLIERLQEIIDAGDWERELGPEFVSESKGTGGGKVERVEGPAKKDVRIARTPQTLTLHLSRSTYYTSAGAYKNTCQVAFPELLDLSSFTDHPPSTAEEEHRDLYRLSSLVVHYGSHSFGHYIAYRRSPSSSSSYHSPSSTTDSSPATDRPEWYRISDETVSPTTLSAVLGGNPVLLFYERYRPNGVRGGARGARGVKARVVRRWEVGSSAVETRKEEEDRSAEVVREEEAAMGEEM